jgi:SLBB domain
MNMHIVHLLAGIFLSLTTALPGKEVWVHFAGQLNKPGVYKVSSPATVEELAKACGGWTEFGSSKRLTVIRLERSSNVTMDDPGEPQSKIYKFSKIPREGEKLILKKDDIVFIPAKQFIGS